ncbi:hypothetical protein F441_14165 [Phytophthora nicotianae CJ01A1]|uniref:Uncharacterized protein n=6 Tax=Phytophthora nicotianae TaxID=4792 RepID=W2PW98_PHYN3|nr:hypothetical protein PPTG_23558 [Phytophthora nicotianae INRA-310]ETI40305.1 hypothetical protein F443_14269 [Phytophthora nicotianae P1569]ETK80417.1 hypothetical protein L915_13906 [Phytophthora nicotianae]ETO69004.1 hypothetical protein F444_14285 [Phytophthora nicotianae P1976]ETP10124.1 hypothetical protein F441_14165 [Phytophthora nicotianae CJ01A1]ETP38210.1 hypothetical protein F442_14111 [Phytophthora nicotianae P10297]
MQINLEHRVAGLKPRVEAIRLRKLPGFPLQREPEIVFAGRWWVQYKSTEYNKFRKAKRVASPPAETFVAVINFCCRRTRPCAVTFSFNPHVSTVDRRNHVEK